MLEKLPLNLSTTSRFRGLRLFTQSFVRNKGAVAGLLFVCIMVVIALFPEQIAPYEPSALAFGAFQAPDAAHWLGTDDLGRDVLSGVVYGSRTSLLVGFSAAGIGMIIGTAIGAISGYFGGRVDDLMMRITEIFMVLPRFFLAIVILAVFGSGLDKVIFVIGILSWPTIARLVRSQFLWLKDQEFVQAARSIGMSTPQIIWSEILPNAISPAIVAGSLEVARAILLEAGLSFLGLGDPNVFSWGTMLRDAQPFLRRAWWMAVGPGIGISLLVLAVNLLGDGLNDALNPQSEDR